MTQVYSNIDITDERGIKTTNGTEDVFQDRVSVHGEQIIESIVSTLKTELPLSNETTRNKESSMTKVSELQKAGRPGRKYRPSRIQISNNNTGKEGHGYGTSVSSTGSSPGRLSSSSSLGTPVFSPLATSPRSPRPPRRLTPLSRTTSEEEAATTTSTYFNNGLGHCEDRNDDDDVCMEEEDVCVDDDGAVFAWNQKPLPSSSSVFKQALTDLNDRPSSSADRGSPGDLMVRRSSLAVTGLIPSILMEVDETEDPSDLGFDLQLGPSSTESAQVDNKEEGNRWNGSSANTVDESSRSRKGHSKRVWGSTSQHKLTHVHDHNKGPNPSANAKLSPRQANLLSEFGKVTPTPSLKGQCSQNGKASRALTPTPSHRTLTRTPSLENETPSNGRSGRVLTPTPSLETDGSWNGRAGGITRERSPRRFVIGDHSTDTSPTATSPMNPHESMTKINMKTAAQIAKFITAAAASLNSPGLNKNQKLLPSSENLDRLPVLDPNGRLVHRRRDESMRMVRQVVAADTAEEDSEVYSWDELRDCRYLRTRKRARNSRRNSLLGFNEI